MSLSKALEKLRSKDPDMRFKTLSNIRKNSVGPIPYEVMKLINTDKDPQCVEKGIEVLTILKRATRNDKLKTIRPKLLDRRVLIKLQAIRSLTILKDIDSINTFEKVYRKTKSELIKTELIEAFIVFNYKKVLPVLKKYYFHEKKLVRVYIVEAAANLEGEESINFLKKIEKKERSNWVRTYIIGELFFLGYEEYISELLSMLKNKNYLVRGATADTLGSVKNTKFRKAILKGLDQALSVEISPYPKDKIKLSIEKLQKIKR